MAQEEHTKEERERSYLSIIGRSQAQGDLELGEELRNPGELPIGPQLGHHTLIKKEKKVPPNVSQISFILQAPLLSSGYSSCFTSFPRSDPLELSQLEVSRVWVMSSGQRWVCIILSSPSSSAIVGFGDQVDSPVFGIASKQLIGKRKGKGRKEKEKKRR